LPEGDTIHKVAAGLRPWLEGATLTGGRLRDDPAAVFAGRRVGALVPHGKHLFIELGERAGLRVHLGMWGSWHRYPPGGAWQKPARQAGVVLITEAAELVCFNPKEAVLTSTPRLTRHAATAHLGPDLIDPATDPETLPARARERLPGTAPLADVLLDQGVAAGIGNIYKSELAFLHRLHPETPLAAVEDTALAAIYTDAARLLTHNTGDAPRTTRFGHDGPRLWVYRRRHRPCLRCHAPIEYARTGRDQRGTYWCPSCQPFPG